MLTEENAWSRVTIYSTEAVYQKVFASYGQARLFESRDTTRDRLLKVLLNEECGNVPTTPVWVGFELHRGLTVIEKFTLGQGVSKVNGTLWTSKTVACFRKQAPVKILAISVNNAHDYRIAAYLGIDAVLADSPLQMAVIKAALINSRDKSTLTPDVAVVCPTLNNVREKPTRTVSILQFLLHSTYLTKPLSNQLNKLLI